MPVLIITPDIRADTCDGATGWASGNQMCIGTKPALVPNPIRASTNTRLIIGRPACAMGEKESKSNDPPCPAISTNITSRSALPRCVATRYVQPARRTSGRSSSNMTRKYDDSAIASHAKRNRRPLAARHTIAMLATSTLKKNHETPRFLRSFQARMYSDP